MSVDASAKYEAQGSEATENASTKPKARGSEATKNASTKLEGAKRQNMSNIPEQTGHTFFGPYHQLSISFVTCKLCILEEGCVSFLKYCLTEDALVQV